MKNIAVFASGGGTDFQSIIDAVERGYIDNAKIKLLITNKAGIRALERAEKHGIPRRIFLRSDFLDAASMYRAMIPVLKDESIDLIVLAGYLGILSSDIVEEFKGKIINVHPSLLPKHSGIGYYGIKVHESVIASGDKVTGVTVHFVTEEVDGGAVVVQRQLPVLVSDTPESLQKRVLELEHEVLPEAVKALCDGKALY